MGPVWDGECLYPGVSALHEPSDLLWKLFKTNHLAPWMGLDILVPILLYLGVDGKAKACTTVKKLSINSSYLDCTSCLLWTDWMQVALLPIWMVLTIQIPGVRIAECPTESSCS